VPKYKMADVVFIAETIYPYTENLCKDYLYTGDELPVVTLKTTTEDILNEKLQSVDIPDDILESLALYRKLCNYLIENADGIIFHSSALMVDGKAYLFAAPSGTGKSTHALGWRTLFPDQVKMINDDKPLIRKIDGKYYAYGNPWNGKHNIGENVRAEVKAICEIKRGDVNVIKRTEPKDIIPTILNQTLRFTDADKMDKLLNLLDGLLNAVNLYTLHCNVTREAVYTSYNAMVKGEL
jgi:hypothetical protein